MKNFCGVGSKLWSSWCSWFFNTMEGEKKGKKSKELPKDPTPEDPTKEKTFLVAGEKVTVGPAQDPWKPKKKKPLSAAAGKPPGAAPGPAQDQPRDQPQDQPWPTPLLPPRDEPWLTRPTLLPPPRDQPWLTQPTPPLLRSLRRCRSCRHCQDPQLSLTCSK